MQSHRIASPLRRNGWTVVELLVAMAILAVLAVLGFSQIATAFNSAQQAVSSNNLRQLAAANLTYSVEHGTFSPATNIRNTVRWHGARSSAREAFDPTKGYLSDYLGASRRVTTCPAFTKLIEEEGSWELGSGGYGYNATYIGGSPDHPFEPIRPAEVPRPAETLMFATTAFAKKNGLQEYPFADPPRWVDPNWKLQSSLQPSVHFRFRGVALIAWCDGHVTAERPNPTDGDNFYGGDNEDSHTGFPGPTEFNGWWNPKRP